MAKPEEISYGENERPTKNRFVCGLSEYSGQSPRLNGLQNLASIGALTTDPFVIKDDVFRVWKNCGGVFTSGINRELTRLYKKVKARSKEKGVHIGRAFYVPNVEEPQGPRTADINNEADFIREVERFYEFIVNDTDYDREGAEITLLTHPFMDTTKPPQEENPLKPYPGGAAFMRDDGVIEIHATFGQDEAVQSFLHDVYTARRTKTGYEITIDEHSKKETLVPKEGVYKKITLDPRISQDRALNLEEIGLIVGILRDLEKKFNKHFRVEFIGQPEGIVFRECTLFTSSEEQIKGAIDIEGSVFVVKSQSRKEIQQMMEGHKGGEHVAYLHQTLFAERNLRLIGYLGDETARTGVTLAVLAYGSSGVTAHRVTNLRARKIPVIFTGEEIFAEGEKIRVYSKEEKLYFEKENPVQWIKDIVEDKKRWGGKAAGLKRLEDTGFPTPSGFAIETSAFRAHLKQSGVQNELGRLYGLPRNATEEEKQQLLSSVRAKIRKTPIDKKTFGFILRGLNLINAETISIRSSATCEDEADNSFAGKFASEIGVDKSNKKKIEDAIREVYASVFRESVFDNANNPKFRIPFEGIEMTIVCHRTLSCEKQGGLHTKYQGDAVVIEAGQGPGATADMKNTKVTAVIKRESDDITLSGPDQLFLSDEEIRELRDYALEIEEAFENPQEVEWVIENGEIVFLQTRSLSLNS